MEKYSKLQVAPRGMVFAVESQNNMNDIADIDPKIVEAVLAHADDFLEAQRRVREIIDAAERKVGKAEENLARQIRAGVSEETATDEYSETNARIRAETETLLKALDQEFSAKYPAPAEVE